jgi:hypothetical protein
MMAAVTHEDGSVTVELGEVDAGLRSALWPLLHRYEGDQVTLDCSGLATATPVGAEELVAFARAVDGRPVLHRPPPALVVALSAIDGLEQFVIDPG